MFVWCLAARVLASCAFSSYGWNVKRLDVVYLASNGVWLCDACVVASVFFGQTLCAYIDFTFCHWLGVERRFFQPKHSCDAISCPFTQSRHKYKRDRILWWDKGEKGNFAKNETHRICSTCAIAIILSPNVLLAPLPIPHFSYHTTRFDIRSYFPLEFL